MAPTVVLITGASRGIGRGIFELYVAKPNHIVIAANRNPSHPDSQELLALPAGEGTTVKLVQLDATKDGEAKQAAETLLADGIDHIDILIMNAGIALAWPTLDDVTIDEIKVHMETNVYGYVRVYQGLVALLKAAKDPKLVTIGSSAAYLTVSLSSTAVFEVT
jgi:NAD(P)-dependent dehydrogenase (short-subunit alcohol dehydrogenase family)